MPGGHGPGERQCPAAEGRAAWLCTCSCVSWKGASKSAGGAALAGLAAAGSPPSAAAAGGAGGGAVATSAIWKEGAQGEGKGRAAGEVHRGQSLSCELCRSLAVLKRQQKGACSPPPAQAAEHAGGAGFELA